MARVSDDDSAFGKALSGLLRAKGYDVTAVTSGSEGLAQFQNVGARAVIIDLLMPDSFGVDIIRQIRASNPETVIIGISGDISLRHKGGGFQSAKDGANIYLSKPFDGDDLIDILEALLKANPRAEA